MAKYFTVQVLILKGVVFKIKYKSKQKGQSMQFIMKFFIILFICNSMVYACDEKIDCEKCAPESELTWNPSNSHITPKLRRFYNVEDLASAAFKQGDYEQTKYLIKEYLELASKYRCNWNYGNAIHNANTTLGLIALQNDQVEVAGNYLIEAGKSKGSPQLDSFGPDFKLANDLLKSGETESVIKYLLGVRKFWENKGAVIDKWIEKITAGDEVTLNRYQPSLTQIAFMLLMYACPLIFTFFFWLRIKSNLINNWQYLIIATAFGYAALFVSKLLYRPTVILLTDLVSSQMWLTVYISFNLISSLGIPFIAVYLVARVFNKRDVGKAPLP